jgi:hypothetical protein
MHRGEVLNGRTWRASRVWLVLVPLRALEGHASHRLASSSSSARLKASLRTRILLLGAPGSLVGTVKLDEKADHMTSPLTFPTRGAIKKHVTTVDRMPLGQLS